VATVALHLQDPGAPSGYLLEAMLDAAKGADRGGGIFAFATADGIRASLHDKAFGRLLKRGTFDLVVGVDSITNVLAVEELARSVSQYAGLSGRVLVHAESVLFHPKVSWFGKGSNLTLIVGSGNLTVRGLRENWEAFTVIALRATAAGAAERQLADWLARHAALLLAPDDPRVLKEAARNSGQEASLRHARRRATTATGDTPPSNAQVLVAEAPKSGGRPSQVNFHKVHYEGFFRAKAGSGRHTTLRNVARDGTIGEAEVRPSSTRKSRNFSLELAGFANTKPPGKLPAIGVYVRLPQGTFLYMRVAPGEPGYADLDGFLTDNWTGPAKQKRQVEAGLSDVRKAWPKSPLWIAEIPSS
jgi:hypothetical protein